MGRLLQLFNQFSNEYRSSLREELGKGDDGGGILIIFSMVISLLDSGV